MGQMEQREIVARNGAEYLLALHIRGCLEERRQKSKVNAEAAREVGHPRAAKATLRLQGAHKVHLVLRCHLARALFERKGRRHHQSINGRPSRYLLVKGMGHGKVRS